MGVKWYKWNREVAEGMAAMHDIPLKKVQDWHLRLTHQSGKKLDYFPKTGRATWMSSNKWFVINDIELFIETFFVTMEQYSIIETEYIIDMGLQGYNIMQKPSSNIEFYGFKDSSVFIQFKSGASYIYKNVKAEDIEAMIKSESIGQFVYSRLKKYEFEKYMKKLVNSKPQ